MTLQDFIRITVNVVHDDGIDEYLPTLIFPELRKVHVIEGIPAGMDHPEAIQNFIEVNGITLQEFFLGVRSAPTRITTVHHRPGTPTRFIDIIHTSAGDELEQLQQCRWWRFG